MYKEIGSNFWLDVRNLSIDKYKLVPEDFNLFGEDCVLLSTGRAALSYALREIKKRYPRSNYKALIPPFTCETVIQPFYKERYDVYTYDIDERLNFTGRMLKESIEESGANVVLIHRYYGFNTVFQIEETIREYRDKGVIFIEDRTQNIYSSFDTLPVDFVVGSFRKWSALPDGGFCLCMKGCLEDKPVLEDRNLVREKLKAFGLKHDYMVMDNGDKKTFLDAYANAEKILDEEEDLYKMSTEAMSILKSLDKVSLAVKRRENYQYLYEKIIEKTDLNLLTGQLEEGVVPLYLAISSQNRDTIQRKLREKKIYAPIVWPKANICPKISDVVQRIYDTVLCIPIDQRYELEDMEKVLNVLA